MLASSRRESSSGARINVPGTSGHGPPGFACPFPAKLRRSSVPSVGASSSSSRRRRRRAGRRCPHQLDAAPAAVAITARRHQLVADPVRAQALAPARAPREVALRRCAERDARASPTTSRGLQATSPCSSSATSRGSCRPEIELADAARSTTRCRGRSVASTSDRTRPRAAARRSPRGAPRRGPDRRSRARRGARGSGSARERPFVRSSQLRLRLCAAIPRFYHWRARGNHPPCNHPRSISAHTPAGRGPHQLMLGTVSVSRLLERRRDQRPAVARRVDGRARAAGRAAPRSVARELLCARRRAHVPRRARGAVRIPLSPARRRRVYSVRLGHASPSRAQSRRAISSRAARPASTRSSPMLACRSTRRSCRPFRRCSIASGYRRRSRSTSCRRNSFSTEQATGATGRERWRAPDIDDK